MDGFKKIWDKPGGILLHITVIHQCRRNTQIIILTVDPTADCTYCMRRSYLVVYSGWLSSWRRPIEGSRYTCGKTVQNVRPVWLLMEMLRFPMKLWSERRIRFCINPRIITKINYFSLFSWIIIQLSCIRIFYKANVQFKYFKHT